MGTAFITHRIPCNQKETSSEGLEVSASPSGIYFEDAGPSSFQANGLRQIQLTGVRGVWG